MKNGLLIFAITSLLVACGGGGSGAGDSPSISGKIADGYIQGATVFWDCNSNKVLDANEVSTTSGSGGAFSISSAPQSGCVIVAKVPVGAIDEDSPSIPIATPYTLVSTPGNEGFVSPLSTLVSAHMQDNPGTSLSDAEKAISQSLGLTGNINSDYISTKDSGVEKRKGVAKIAATILQSNNSSDSPAKGMSSALAQVQSIAPQLDSVNYSSNTAIDNFLNPFKGFLKLSTPVSFKKTDAYAVRPNSGLGLTEAQLTLLDGIITDAQNAGAVRNGVIKFVDYSFEDLVKIKLALATVDLPLNKNSDSVQRIIVQRDSHINQLTENYYKSMSDKVTWYNTDLLSNFQFITSTSISTIEAVSGAISFATNAPSIDLRKFRSRPQIRAAIKVAREYKVQEVTLALLNGLNAAGSQLSPSSQALIKKFATSDGSNITKEDYDAMLELVDGIVGIAKDSFKTKKMTTFGKVFSPAVALYSAYSVDCSNALNFDCVYSGIEVLESLAEWLHFPTAIQGEIQWIRATMDAYSAGEEYANATTMQISVEQEKITSDYNARVKQYRKFWMLQELGVAGVDKLFESYDPSIACDAGQTRKHGVCTASATAMQIALASGVYVYNNDASNTCYSKSTLGSSAGTNEFFLAESQYCLNSAKTAWVLKSTFSNREVLTSSGWMNAAQQTIRFGSDSTATLRFGGVNYSSGALATYSGDASYPSGSRIYDFTITSLLDEYSISPGNSYISNNAASISALFGKWNSKDSGQSYLMRGGDLAWAFDTPSASSAISGVVRYYNPSEQLVCTITNVCSRSVITSATWVRNTLADGSDAIELRTPTGYSDTNLSGYSGEKVVYIKRFSDSGVVEGQHRTVGATSIDRSYNKTYFDAYLQKNSLPITVN